MVIADRRQASAWVASWIAAEGHIRPGILSAVLAGWRKSLAIMNGSPSRYTEADRENLREAIDYLTSTDWTKRLAD